MATSALTEAVFSLPGENLGGSIALARDFARRTARNYGYTGCHDDLVLVVSELVTNAVRHGRGLPVVRIVGDTGRLRVEVSDDSAARPRRGAGGWGLELIDRIGERWGVIERDGRKVVWCELTA